MTNTFTDATAATGSTYGTIAGVQRYLAMHTLTSTSKPSLTDAAEYQAVAKRAIDAFFDPDPRYSWEQWATDEYGYWPTTGDTSTLGMDNVLADDTALALMADAEDLLTAAALLETLQATRPPTAANVVAATTGPPDSWRTEAHNLLVKARKRHRTSAEQLSTHARHRRTWHGAHNIGGML